ncbi:MAG: N-acyl homoserine lactone hydrolase [Thermoleophilaceae bacterium]|nr:N-acyl homoserine lactone hydrolase [Thermoleophilaceae bacterium]
MPPVAPSEPKPAELPLVPGRTDATVRVHPLLTGTAAWPEAWPHRADGPLAALRAIGVGSPTVPIPLPSFLVEHPSAGPILIDTGLDPAVAEGKKESFGRLAANTTARSFRLERAQAATEQLRARGVDPADVQYVLMTHLHLDHASGMRQFPHATFVMSRPEWDSFHAARAFTRGYVSGHLPDDGHYRTLDFEGDRAGSLGAFGRTLDLLGDGSVVAASTPGHTAGHLSVVLRTEAGEVVVAGDAVYTRHALATGHVPYLMYSRPLFERSLHELQRHAEANPDALIIPGHDMAAWQDLEAVY